MLEIATAFGFTIRLIIAIFLGFLIGFERQWTRHQAGVLTNVIVCMGAYMFCSFSMLATNSTDVTRIAAQVVSGIGFLGAGVILRDGFNIRGLNTAATVWASSAVGVLCCLENPIFAVIGGVAIVLAHLLFHPLSSLITKMRFSTQDLNSEKTYSISVECSEEYSAEIREELISIIKSEKRVILNKIETFETEQGHLKTRAYLFTPVSSDIIVEKLLTKMVINKRVISSGWKIID